MGWVIKYIFIDLLIIAGFITIVFIAGFIKRLINYAKNK